VRWSGSLSVSVAAFVGTVAAVLPAWRVAADEPPAAKTRVTVFLLPAQGFSDKLIARISNRLRHALRKNPKLKVKDWNKLLTEFSGETPSDALQKAETQRDEAMALLEAGEHEEAVARLEQTVSALEELLAFAKKRDFAETLLALGVAHARAGDAKAAYRTFVRLLVWRPMIRFDTAKFGPKDLPVFERARRAIKKRKRGSIELLSDPPGAKAYVDGRFMGVTPTVAFGLPVGRHYATFKKPGFIKAARPVDVDPNRQTSHTQELKRSNKFLLVQQTLARAKPMLGKVKAGSAMVDLRNILFVDQVVFATMGYAGPDQVNVQAYLYDLRSKLRLNQSAAVVHTKAPERLDQLAEMLYLDIRYDGTLPAPPEPPPPPAHERRRFYATWWFWTAIAAGAAAITLTATFWPTDDSCQGNAGGRRCILFNN